MATTTKSKAEEIVFKTAKAQLQPFEIISSTPFVTDARGKVREGELDLLIFHPGLGLLVLEVKGGGIRYDGHLRRWYSNDQHDEWHEIKDPFEQGQNAVRALLDILCERVFTDGPCPLPVGNAVVFPGVVWIGDLPAHASADLIIDSHSLNDLARVVPRIMRQFSRSHTRELDEEEAELVREKVLYPTCCVLPTLSSTIEGEKRELLQMTEEQYSLLEDLEETRQIAIRGHAGTGKTRLAVEKAVRLYNDGKKVALLCYNQPLGDSLRHELLGKSNRLIVNSFHRFCRERCIETGVKFDIPRGAGESEFWEREAPMRLLEALEKKPGNFDAVIVDEGQDFSADWWEVIWEMLREKREGILYVFFDPRQAIYKRELKLPVPELQLVLKKNCRNTKSIGELVSAVGEVKMTWPKSAVKGEPPEFVSCRDQAEMLAKMDEVVKRLVTEEQVSPEQIVCLSTHSRKNSCLADAKKLGGVALTDDLLQPGNKIRFSSLHRFKGLEADVILLADVVNDPEVCSDEYLYVAVSRARHRLAIFHEPRWKPKKHPSIISR